MDENSANASGKSVPTNGVRTSPTSGGDGVGEDEKEDEPSSSTSKQEEELDNFRLQWKKELSKSSPEHDENQSFKSSEQSISPKGNENVNNTNELESKDNIVKQAKRFYLSGVHEERAGRLYEAIAFYRRAVQLVPDIEFQVTSGLDNSEQSSTVDDLPSDESVNDDSSIDEDDELSEIPDLISHFERVLTKTGAFQFCKPYKHQNNTHISELPHEVFNYILKWVVSTDLDCHSLEEIAKVCRGFYLSAREDGIWRLACLRVWGVNCGLPNKYGSWRNMFIYRPHLWFHGAYISKTSYVRYGESSFQDSNYRPCYVVHYFRYLRFFPDGVVLMLTTPDDPYQSLSKLKQRRSRHPTVMSGHYRLIGSMVTVILKRPKAGSFDYHGASSGMGFPRFKRQPLRPKMGQDPAEESFHIELEIQAVKQRPNFKLAWKHYSLHRLFRNCQESVSEIDISPTNFPPFLFSRVKSFNMSTEQPLQ